MAGMRNRAPIRAFFTRKILAAEPARVHFLVHRCPSLAVWERWAMLKSKNVVSALRRDASFVWHAIIVVVFVGFAGLAVAAALLDLLSIRY